MILCRSLNTIPIHKENNYKILKKSQELDKKLRMTMKENEYFTCNKK